MKKRFLALLLAVALLCVTVSASAVTYPAQQGNVNDDAQVLSESVTADIASLNKLCKEVSAEFVVVTRHFLGGEEAQNYCDGLFKSWELDSDSALLLLVIGEEKYAVTLGSSLSKTVSQEQLSSLLATSFRTPFLEKRDYDGAVGSFLLAFASLAAKNQGKTINTAGLFGTSGKTSSTSDNNSSSSGLFSGLTDNWWSGFFSSDTDTKVSSEKKTENNRNESRNDDEGIGFGSIVLVLFILYFVFFRRKGRKAGSGSSFSTRPVQHFTTAFHSPGRMGGGPRNNPRQGPGGPRRPRF